ncbi:MAG TPA: TrkA family potassium uptake protein [Candidatus Limnocylindrales bacterium]|nr:TrkA family potassium uptake protein [Candidatus Limnocylindrales bacterium]
MKQSVLVIGLGRFGSAAARELMALGHEVLVVDRDESRVNDIAPDVTHAIQADASDEAALRSLGAADFDHAIVAISGDAEPSIFATMALKNLGVRNVVAKAGTALHGAILERVGANRVVYPEREMGTRVAHAFDTTHVIDYLDVAPGFGIVRFSPPPAWIGRSLREIDLQGRFQLAPIGLRRGPKVTVNPHRDEVLNASDELILIGLDDNLEKLEDADE